MTSERGQMLDIFDQGTCSVCAACEINQYFNIDESYLDYKGTFYSLREILKDTMDLQILNKQRIKQEICLDCKDKVVKFFHIKWKAKEIQMRNNSRSKDPQQDLNMCRSTIVHNIVKIVKNYSEKCPISKIRIDETSGKLIIESDGNEENSGVSINLPQAGLKDDDHNFINIKEEPKSNEILVEEADENMYLMEKADSIGINDSESCQEDEDDEEWIPYEPALSTSKGLKRRKLTSSGISATKEQTFKGRPDFFNILDEKDFLRRFRISKQSFRLLLEKLRPKIQPTNARNAMSVETRLLTALRFYATGSLFINIADFIGISESSVSTAVAQVSEAIASLRTQFIFMPSDRDELQINYRGFDEIGSFPNVVGTINCTHVKISDPGSNYGEVFRNRKQFFSINVQSVAKSDLTFQDIVVRWPGSTKDSHIFNHSRIKQRFESGEFKDGLLLGSDGYKLMPYLMTPICNPVTDEEATYNRSHNLVWNTIERKYDVWKRRFPCLVQGLSCKVENSLTVIVACAVLHNFCIREKDELPAEDPETEAAIIATTLDETSRSEQDVAGTENASQQSILKRQSLVQQISLLNS